MRHTLVIFGGLLLVTQAGCASAPAAETRTASTVTSDAENAAPDETQIEDPLVAPPIEVVDQAQPTPVEKTAEQVLDEQQDRLDTEQRETDARDVLAEHAAVKTKLDEIVITISNRVLFGPEQATLLPSSQDMLSKIAAALLVTQERNLFIKGHTDTNGSPEGNVALSRQRAEAVRTYLIAKGYPEGLIRATGIGEDHPVSTNASSRGRAQNERLEIVAIFGRGEAL